MFIFLEYIVHQSKLKLLHFIIHIIQLKENSSKAIKKRKKFQTLR